ncbi:hypothetical protein ACFL6Y_05245 [Elusimicrobiota bacterium]
MVFVAGYADPSGKAADLFDSANASTKKKNSNNPARVNSPEDLSAINIAPLHFVDPPAHQWIAFQARATWTTPEIDSYLPPAWSDNVPELDKYMILYGSRMEDDDFGKDACYPHKTCFPCLGWTDSSTKDAVSHPYCHHYWNTTGTSEPDPDAGLYYLGVQWDSSYKRAQVLWDDKVIPSYKAGNKKDAYYWLGRVAHLLIDTSVPAHTHLDVHILGDSYEGYVKDHYRAWKGEGSPTPALTLKELFHSMAEMADDFDSDHKDGEIDKGSRNVCKTGKCGVSKENCRIIGDVLMPQAMRHTAALYKLFWETTHP